MKRLTIYSNEYWIKKGYTEEEAITLVNKSKKETSPWNKEFWIKKGYTEEEAINKVKELQSKNSKKRKKYTNNYDTNTWIKKGYTEEEAINKINILKQKSNVFNSLNETEINNMLDNRRKTYYSKTIEERQEINKSRGRTKEQLIKTFGKEYTENILKRRGNANRNYNRRFSKISKIFFDDLQQCINDKLYYVENEKWIRINKNKGYFVDLTCGDKIIEFNGDFFHANPKIYEKNDIIKISKDKILVAEKIWKDDNKKQNILKEKGYKLLVIWEYDVKNNREQMIKKCIDFLKK